MNTLDTLPQPLIKLARSQIIKGPSLHGVSGNVGEVADARRLVYACLTMSDDETRQYLKEWKAGHDVKDEPEASSKGGKRETISGDHKEVVRPYVCPRCGGAI